MSKPALLPIALLVFPLLVFWNVSPTLRAQDHDDLIRKGIEASDKGNYDEAIASYSQAILLNPANAQAYCDRAIAYAGKGNYARAMEDYDRAVRTDPRYLETYYNRGLTYSHQGQYAKAIADFERAIQLNPEYVHGTGIEKLKPAVEFNGTDRNDMQMAEACDGLAWLCATCPQPRFRDGQKAVKYALKAGELSAWTDPDHKDTLAAAYAESGDFRSAVKWETKYLEEPHLSEADYSEAKQRLALYREGKPYREDR